MIRALRLITVIVATVASGCQSQAPESTLTGRTMGTTYTVRIGDCAPDRCGQANKELIEARLEELQQIFSHYRPDTELSRFNRHTTANWFPVSTELATLAQLALDISRLSGGAFDVTVAPAVDVWGFGPDLANSADDNFGPGSDQPAPPDDNAIQQAAEYVDYRKLEVSTTPPRLRKHSSGLRLDMSAIAKGYAVDEIAYLLEAAGLKNYLVEIGGEVRTAGTRPDGKVWRIAIEPPDIETPDTDVEIEFIVQPGNNAVASSGDYRNYFEHEGKVYSHTMDPTTGRPVTHQLASVSVIAPSAAQADALATALLVLGLHRGTQVANENGLAALFVQRDDTGMRTSHTAAFTRYLLND